VLGSLLADIQPAQERIYVFHCQQWRSAQIPESWFADLSVEEQQVHSEAYRKQRAIRRHILAACCGIKPSEIIYDLRQDKPRIHNPGISDFSIAHTMDDLVVAVVFTQRCGVDYESPRKVSYAQAIAARFFTDNEQTIWRARQDDPDYFFYLWTLKEAAIKCAGSGMFQDAKHYDFSTHDVLYKDEVTQNRRVSGRQDNGYWGLVFSGLQTQLHYRTCSMATNRCTERIIPLGGQGFIDLDAK
jgi:phosphopantetheine--protein transferase-like protein